MDADNVEAWRKGGWDGGWPAGVPGCPIGSVWILMDQLYDRLGE